MLDVNSLTLGEVAFIEDMAGESISGLGEDSTPKGKLLAALVVVTKRRDGEPQFKFGDALALTMSEAMEAIGLGGPEESDPFEASDPQTTD